jgi:hypothetical protein
MFQEALVSKLPDTIMSIFEEAIDTANKGLVNWIFKHRGMKVLSILSLPYTLPAEIVYATFTKYASETGSFLYLLESVAYRRKSIILKLIWIA